MRWLLILLALTLPACESHQLASCQGPYVPLNVGQLPYTAPARVVQP